LPAPAKCAIMKAGGGHRVPPPLGPPESGGRVGRENITLRGPPFDRLRTGLGMRKREIDRKFDEIVAFGF